jgi:F420-0:gamma-glutamyl ligase
VKTVIAEVGRAEALAGTGMGTVPHVIISNLRLSNSTRAQELKTTKSQEKNLYMNILLRHTHVITPNVPC